MQSHQMSLIDIDLNVSIVDTGTDDADRQEETPTTHLSSNGINQRFRIHGFFSFVHVSCSSM